MKTLTKVISALALVATIGPSVLYFIGVVEHSMVLTTSLLGTIVWFVATPLWMGRELPIDAAEVEI